MTEHVEPVVSDHNRNSVIRSISRSVSGRRFTALLAVLVMIAGFVVASVQPAAATPPASLVWTPRTAAEANSWYSVAYGNGTFVAVSYNGTDQVMTSTDGITWTTRNAAGASYWHSVTYGGGMFVAVSIYGPAVMTSIDGITWTARTSPPSGWYSVTYGGGMFVAVSYNGTAVMTSADGINWVTRAAPEANGWDSVAYGGGTFVAVSWDGTNRVMTSSDGINWVARSATEANAWNSVTYGGGIFVAVAGDGSNRVMTSSDGITWIARSAAEANGWLSVTYGGGTFVAVSWDGTNRVMTSADGFTWTAQTASEANTWFSVTYGGGTFVAVSSDGTHRVMTGAPFVPTSAPAAPTSLVATPGNGSVSIAFTPGDAGSSAITKYQYKIGSGSWLDAPAGTSSPITISGLTNYASNSIKLRAFSTAGAGTESSPVSVTSKVSAPLVTSAYSGTMAGVVARGIVVGFTGVISPGATVVSYRVTAYVKGTNTVVSTVLFHASDRTAFLGGVTKGVEYDVRVIGYLTLSGSPLITRGTNESATQTVKV